MFPNIVSPPSLDSLFLRVHGMDFRVVFERFTKEIFNKSRVLRLCIDFYWSKCEWWSHFQSLKL